MSEPDGAEIGRRIGDHSADIIADDAVACCAAAVLPDSPILPATRVRLATVAARYSWNFVLTLPK